ncbi:MAG: UvrD-helicase domain-containing protein [Actinomycetales bacterium]|nr:UvrD-helicase domain-containing protein [Actinomycetales bacterium]
MSTADRLPDQDARDAAASTLGLNAFIEAGAGTGKSTTLVSRILNTVTGPSPVAITSIAAITFTERAGAELRHRLRERIAGRLAKGVDDPADLRSLAAALEGLDSAPIGTIHAFAQRILRTHALSAGLPLGFAPATGADAIEDEASRLRSAVESLQATLDAGTRSRLAAYDLAPYDLLAVLGELDRQWLRLDAAAFDDRGPDVSRLCAQVADAFEDVLVRARSACADSGDRLMAAFEEGIPPVVAQLRRADPDELAAAYAAIEGTHPVFRLGVLGTKAAWGEGMAKAWRDQLKDLAPSLHACLLAPLEGAVRQALAQAWQVMHAHRQARSGRGIVTFDELLSRARDLVRDDPEVRALVHAQFPVVLVDEFQDTDPVQWELIRLITADPTDSAAGPLPGRLIVVGDPKQAIYAFRGADVDTYAQALCSFTSPDDPIGQVFELTTNFRSVAPLIDWVNRTFAAAMTGQPAQVAYRDLDIRHRPQADAAGPAVTVIRDPEPAADDSSTPTTIASTWLEPRLVAQEIGRAIHDRWLITEPGPDDTRHYTRPATFGDVAVLYPARTGVPALLDALDEAGVPYRSGDAGLVFQRPVVLGLLAALAVIDDPACELDLWLALKSPLFGCTDIDLLQFRRAGGRWRLSAKPIGADDQAIDGPVVEALAVLDAARRSTQARSPASVIDRLLERTRIMEALAHAPRGAFDADCVRMLRAHAQQFQDEGGVGLTDYLRAASDIQSDATRASLPEPDIRDDNAVRLMTVHQAKGLEFGIVALAGMASNMYDRPPRIGVASRERYEFNLGDGLESVCYQQWSELDRDPRTLAERVRLHYVACTRARDHLIISICGEEGTNKRPHSSLLWAAIPRQASDVCSLDARPIPVDQPVPVGQPMPVDQPAPAVALALAPDWSQQVERIRSRSQVPFIAAPSGQAAAILGLTPAAATQESPPDATATASGTVAADARASRDGRPFGRAVHAALDRVMQQGSGARDEDISTGCLLACEAEQVTDELTSVRRLVDAALGCELMRRAMASPRRWMELYLAAPVDDEQVRLVEGFADLLFEDDAGLILVDYKTDASISAEVRQHYADQLRAYAELIRRSTGKTVTACHILHLSADGATVLSA